MIWTRCEIPSATRAGVLGAAGTVLAMQLGDARGLHTRADDREDFGA